MDVPSRDEVEMCIPHLRLRCANVDSYQRNMFLSENACRGVVFDDLDFWNILDLLYADGFD
jgi:hypothetical protein